MQFTAESIWEADLWDLGTYRPEDGGWKEYLEAFLPRDVFVYRWLMSPIVNWGSDRDIRNWHRDVARESDDHAKFYMALWADLNPTQLTKSISSKSIITPKPYQVLLIRNDVWLHRQPEMSFEEKKKRSFARAYITPKGSGSYLELEYGGEEYAADDRLV